MVKLVRGHPSLLALSLLLPGCEGRSAVPGAPLELERPAAPSEIRFPTLGPLPAPPIGTGQGFRSDFVRAFTDGLEIEREGERVEVRVQAVGNLHLAQAGGLLAGDPMGPDLPLALPVRLPAAEYPVEVSRARFLSAEDGDEEQVAAARVRFDTAAAVDWRWVGQFSLGSGLCAFLSPAAAQALGTASASLHSAILRAVEANPLGAELLATQAMGAADLAFCPAGDGEGSVELYVGVDAEGNPVEVVADFLVLVEPDEEIAAIPNPAGWPPGILPSPLLDELGIELRRAHPGESVPTTGAPCWMAIDARSIARDARIGFPRIRAWNADGEHIELIQTTEGYRIWLPEPAFASSIARLEIVLQMGVKAL